MYLKLSKWIENIAFKLRQKALYFELKYYIKNKQTYLKPVHYYMRGIGKTFTLIQLAKKYKCPIATPTSISGDYIKRICKKYNIKSIEIIPCSHELRGKRYEKILCDEGIKRNFLNEVLMPMCKQIIGFVNID